MLRIPNPGSDIDGFIRIFRDLHPFLREKVNFSLDDITKAMIAKRNVTSQGAIGDEALKRSTRPDRSRDPLYNQSKMYAELYRTLGWIHSADSSLTFCITTLGHHVAMATDPRALMKECLLGIAYPSEVLSVHTRQIVRAYGTMLQTIAALGTLSRDEMMAGPMSIPDDSRQELVDAMINKLRRMRAKPGALDRRLDAIARERGIKRSPTMENYTRYPMAALSWAGWAEKAKPGVLAVTVDGRATAARVRSSTDFRLPTFHALQDDVKQHFIVSTAYRLLERGGFDLSPVDDLIVLEDKVLYNAGVPADTLFSPFQQLSRQTIEKYAPEMIGTEGLDTPDAAVVPQRGQAGEVKHILTSTVLLQAGHDMLVPSNRGARLVDCLKAELASAEHIISDAVENVAGRLETANKNAFYPLVVDLLCLLGFDCRLSRAGVNYARWDAIIVDKRASIPVEIKSPGEEREISVKAVRQALENKIILRSRKAYSTGVNTTSLIIGFNPPNERSEVHELIEDIHVTFGVRISVIDFRTLLNLALQSVRLERTLILPGFQTMKGLVRVEVAQAERQDG